MFMAVMGYELKQGEKIVLEFIPVNQCPVVGQYIVRTMQTLEVRDSEGNLVKDLLNHGN